MTENSSDFVNYSFVYSNKNQFNALIENRQLFQSICIQIWLFSNGRERSRDSRANMLRSAFAAQRMQTDRTTSEGGTYSFDSSTTIDLPAVVNNETELLAVDVDDEDDSLYPSAEDFLFELGFGGPPQGIERIPQRFLQSSQVIFHSENIQIPI